MKVTVTYEIDTASVVEFVMELQKATESTTTQPTYGEDQDPTR